MCESERERERTRVPRRDDEHFRRLVSCRAIKKWTMSRDDITRGSELRYGKTYVTAGYSIGQKPTFYYTLKEDSALFRVRHRSIVHACARR